MNKRVPNRFNPNLGVSNHTPEEPIYRFSWWPVIGFILALIILSLVMPSPVVRALPRETVSLQRAFHDHVCDDLHRQTHHLKHAMERYDQSTELTEQRRLWSEVTQINTRRNESIHAYRDALLRQAVGGNTPIFDINEVCRFSTIRLQPVSLVARH